MTPRRIVLLVAIAAALCQAARRDLAAGSDRTKRGGPNRNFMSDAMGLALISFKP